jgi:hypothetical protein
MKFSKQVSEESLHDAWMTFSKYFQCRPKITKQQFFEMGKYKYVKLSFLRSGQVENIDPDRLQPSPELAYPINNRPRNENDIQSVVYHLDATDISPCVMVKKNENYIFLDGVHRVVAANILHRKTIPVYVLYINC